MKRLIPFSVMMFGCMMTVFADSADAVTAVQDNLAAVQDDACCPKPCPPKPCCIPTCCPEIVEDCCAFNKCPPTCQVTPNAGPRVNGGADLFFTAAFTWWTAHEDGLAFAYIEEDFIPGVATTAQVPTTTVAIPDFKWKPGFKVGAGLDFCHDGWDVYLDYTWFHSMNNRKSISVDPAGTPDVSDGYWLVNAPYLQDVLLPIAAHFRLDFYETVTGNLALKWNIFDLELGRNFYISRRIKLRPHFGLKGMWARQTFNLVLDNKSNNGATNSISTMNNKIKNWGIGVRAGLDTAWQFCESFSLIGEIAATGLWEQFKVHRIDATDILITTVIGTAGTSPSSVNYQYNFYSLRPVIEWFLGLRWEMWTCGDDFHFEFDAGWETQLWFSQNQFLRIECLEADHGDLAFQGLTVRARFDF